MPQDDDIIFEDLETCESPKAHRREHTLYSPNDIVGESLLLSPSPAMLSPLFRSSGVLQTSESDSRPVSRRDFRNLSTPASRLTHTVSQDDTMPCELNASIMSNMSNISRPESSYSTDRSQIAKFATAPRFSFGNTKRFAQDHCSKEVGPGDHEAVSPRRYLPDTLGFSRGVAFAKSGRQNMSKSHSQPGPGAYTPETSTKSGPHATFGTSSRSFAVMADPGPGDYEATSPRRYLPNTLGLGAGAAFAKSTERAKTRSTTPLLGPGSYAPEKSLRSSGPRATFSTASREIIPKPSVPGPGAYESTNYTALSSYRVSSKFSVPSRRRRRECMSNLSPGPCAYNPHAASAFGK